ncbi:potassium channel family protein [Prescottella agglutinans]|uniref:Voltage-gated potassium channel n=1 Tax=Prescottella agglutinans TaxID=1644129 RepID=A0ABT6MKW4_9NOCA|nr:potassium channel family protein [Prescottella agglutinans]MDH6284525.1 voltage-gated potassium channel [Prescottella agglutinans]
MTSAHWQQRTELPLIGASLLFLAAYAWNVLAQPTGMPAQVADVLMALTWAMFAVDFIVRLALVQQRGRWILYHLHELAMVALPMLRPLRLLRLITLLGVLQRSIGTALRGRVVTYAGSATTLLILIASLAMLDAERSAPDAAITTFPDALWWAAATITTVGYGDYTPVTATGRLVAAALMLAGIALLGVVTATLASWLVQRISEEDETNQAATQAEIAALTEELAHLRAELRATRLSEPQTLTCT